MNTSSGIYYPNLLVIDEDDPQRNSFDSGGVPGEAMRALLRVGPTMSGVYDIRHIGVDLRFAASYGRASVMPTVRLIVRRTPLPPPR